MAWGSNLDYEIESKMKSALFIAVAIVFIAFSVLFIILVNSCPECVIELGNYTISSIVSAIGEDINSTVAYAHAHPLASKLSAIGYIILAGFCLLTLAIPVRIENKTLAIVLLILDILAMIGVGYMLFKAIILLST